MRDVPVLSLRKISLSFGTRSLFQDVDLHVNRFDHVTLVGPNGSGKSTLMKVMAGLLPADEGEIYYEPGLRVAYVPQEATFDTKYSRVEDYFRALLPDPALFYKAQTYADALEVDFKRTWEGLSGGEQRRLSLVRALMEEADLLLLDEPTNHLDLTVIQWLETFLKDFQGAFVVISHDRTFLETITDTVLWLDRSNVRRLDKGFQHFDSWQEVIVEQEVKENQRLGKLLEKETHWLHRGVTARRKRNQGRLRRLEALRAQRSTLLRDGRSMDWARPKEIPASQVVMEAFHLTKAYGDRTLVSDFSTRILKGDRIGIIGPNGAGKTTLLKMLTGEVNPDEGHVKLGKQNQVVYLDQHRQDLNPLHTVKETLCPGGGDHVGVGEDRKHVVGYLKEFLFEADHMNAPVSTLSGGERNRLLLAKALSLPSSVLVLDEPTNDLDMDTLDKLQSMLDEYPGTLLIVSHDRSFLDHTVSSIIAFEENGRVTEYAGGYQDYLSQRRLTVKAPSLKQAAPPPPRPKEAAKRLSFNQVHRLKALPQELSSLEVRRTTLEAQLSDATLYARDAVLFQKLTLELEGVLERKDLLETEWMELALLQEELSL